MTPYIQTYLGESMKFRKKPVVIEAEQWDGTYTEAMRIQEKLGVETAGMQWHEKENTVSLWEIYTLEGNHTVSKRDFIIKGVKGECYPCKPDIFEQTYEKVED